MLCSHGHSREQRGDIVCHPLLPSKAICQHFLVHISTQSWEGVTRCPLTNCRHTASSGKWARNVQWCDRPCQYMCVCVCVAENCLFLQWIWKWHLFRFYSKTKKSESEKTFFEVLSRFLHSGMKSRDSFDDADGEFEFVLYSLNQTKTQITIHI